MTDLNQARIGIDSIDDEILNLIRRRLELACGIADYKMERGLKVIDRAREEEKLSRLMATAVERGIPPSFIHELYRTIMSNTVSYEQSYLINKVNEQGTAASSSVAFLGPAGSYSHLAAGKFLENFHGHLEERSCNSFDAIVSAVENGECEYGVLPVENSSSGSINEVLDLLSGTRAYLVGELFCPIDHAVLALPGARLDGITDLYSHPQPVSQCSRWLREHLPGVQIHYTKSSSDAMSQVARSGDPQSAALGSLRATSIYQQLSSLADHIADNPHNYTRFVAIAMTRIMVPTSLTAKTSILFSVEKYRPGTLLSVLNAFADNGINLVKLSSRPRKYSSSEIWEEIFFADLEANLDEPKMQEILMKVRTGTVFFKILGCYPSADSQDIPRERGDEKARD